MCKVNQGKYTKIAKMVMAYSAGIKRASAASGLSIRRVKKVREVIKAHDFSAIEEIAAKHSEEVLDKLYVNGTLRRKSNPFLAYARSAPFLKAPSADIVVPTTI